MKKEQNGKGRLSLFALLAFAALFCVSSYKVFSQLIVDYQQSKAFTSLIEQVYQARGNPDMLARGEMEEAAVAAAQGTGASAPAQFADSVPDARGTGETAPGQFPSDGASARESAAQGENGPALGQPAGVSGANPSASPEPPMLSAYAPLHSQNEDFFGWIEIADTEVNYPVMHTPEDPEFYLHRGFDRAEVYSGVPFLSADCFLGCGNFIVFGHNMKNGTQFATIPKYKNKAFWEAHPSIRFDTLYETGIYDVVAAFYSQAYPEDAVGVFRYYRYSDLRKEETFAEYVEQVKAVALYETGIELQFGDQLLTLSTCEYHKTDGRFVVVARKR